jgi:cell division protein FtsI/penicillin-binding protein 2
VGLVGEGDDPAQATPRYAVAVILENAGSGGRAAGPMGAAVIRALIDEGHLEPRRNAAPGSAGERRGGAG